jgi:hypothetical protein
LHLILINWHNNNNNNSALKRVQLDHKISVYGPLTGTNNLRNHLTSNLHIDQWVNELTKRNLTVKAEAGLKAIADYQGKPLDSQTSPRLSYTPELFVDTVVDLIISTDLVFIYLFIYFYYTNFSLAY